MTERYKKFSFFWRYDETLDIDALYLETLKSRI
jgi:hypothetical protein